MSVAALAERGSSASIDTYYDQPALKPSPWGVKVSTYIFVAGVAGSAQIIAAAADLAGGPAQRGVVRNGRYLALAGVLAGAPLLIADLHTPQRFYNMLRIFRPTSPMSIGTYALTGFGGCSAVLAAAQAVADAGGACAALDAAARLVQLPAAALGALMSTYTGALLGATSTPLWAAAPRLLPAAFGASAVGAAAAALSLAAPPAAAPALGRIELAASAAELLLVGLLRRRVRAAGVETGIGVAPLLLTAAAPLLRVGVERITGQRPLPPPAPPPRPSGAAAASVAVLAGAFLLRHLVLRAGNRSARQPRDHFRLARPR